MPSTQKRDFDEPARPGINRSETELRSLLQAIDSSNISKLNLVYPRGKVLFTEGAPGRGAFILRRGRATVSISSSEGRLVILRVAQAGDVLGLHSVMRNSPYSTTVKTIESCRIDFIPCAALMELMEKSQPAAQAISQVLSREVGELTARARSLLLPQTVTAKLAGLLLEWCEEHGANTVSITRSFTHEEIAHMICSSRETVTRLLASLTSRKIIRVTPDSIHIFDREALQKVAVI